MAWLFVFFLVIMAVVSGEDSTFAPCKQLHLKAQDSILSSVVYWDTIDESKKISLLSVAVEHRNDGNWYIPSLHKKYSIGWNRSVERGHLNRPTACNIRFYGIGLASTLKNFKEGGSGFVTFHFVQENYSNKGPKLKHMWHGFDKNETNKLYCYYETNSNYGSDFVDNPKTYGMAIYCPLSLDDEVGSFQYRNVMHEGYFCRAIAEHPVEIELTLRPSDFQLPPSQLESDYTGETISARAVSTPSAQRLTALREASEVELPLIRSHAVCTVQTFRNNQTGPMLHLFASYYLLMGWRVIIYDRFGFHKEFLLEFLKHPGLHYHPYTVFQLANPTKYNDEYAAKQGWGMKYFYKMEKNWGFTGASEADTADQDQDKTKTYDLVRLEYAHVDSILYIDSDEFFYCPQAAENSLAQRRYQQRIMNDFSALGVEEMRFVRLPYSGIAPADFPRNSTRTGKADFTTNTMNCMQRAYDGRNVTGMIGFFRCWSSATAMDNFPKSSDFAGKCPFHYNHWSCDGGRSGGRDAGLEIPRCRCKVSLDLNNFYEFRPMLKRCHLLHFNDNKYSFQSRREGHKHDKGNFFSPCPIVDLFNNNTSAADKDRDRDRDGTDTHTGIRRRHHLNRNHGPHQQQH